MNRSNHAALPLVNAGVDVWDWGIDRAIPRHRLRRKLEHQAGIERHIGLVLHPRCLRSPWEQGRLVSVLNFVQKSGVVATSLRELAAAGMTKPEARRRGPADRLRSFFGLAERRL
jgi:hypothetical protein